MYVKRVKKCHLSIICGWLRDRNLPGNLLNNTPKIGYIAFDGTIPVALLFLRKVEGRLGLADSGVSNPSVSPAIRRQAMDMVSVAVMECAKKMGILEIAMFTSDPNTIQRAKDFGGVQQDAVLISKKL